jgi:hypothetical protein
MSDRRRVEMLSGMIARVTNLARFGGFEPLRKSSPF